jgi:hypothetical protein
MYPPIEATVTFRTALKPGDERQLYFPPGDKQISGLELSPARVNDN